MAIILTIKFTMAVVLNIIFKLFVLHKITRKNVNTADVDQTA